MGYYTRFLVLRPRSTAGDVARLSDALGRRGLTAQLIHRHLPANAGITAEKLPPAMELGLTIVTVERGPTSQTLIDVAIEALGKDAFLLREFDDEELDYVYPSPAWLNRHMVHQRSTGC